ncbi:MAG: acyltransferase [Furfurilactobacillus sp.]|uniref:acyltransferase n=1 Tax=Furfurilactobacillus sp. TaxID=2767911 RepID=UPI00259038CF|nr:acyltransferase [Furfurilactobacillus sp.]MCH4012692.1 acyltransferase [Furfurilactobacillus sp.]MCH4036275.1 acyltransferase [Furfurilactobacillus sp.]MCH4114779.1 acyltransferase [Furfurilactobacillus sp.]MCH4133644.1 acyltransferase [Furfurilactobacillus sp.]MCI1387185.1 acyltransferase [Furfurilactobacillus sp.]
MKKRILTLDVIRSIAIVLVVACHSLQQTIPAFNIDGSSQQFVSYSIIKQILAVSVFILGRTGVPLFLILSGYLMIDRPYNNKSYLKHFLLHNLLPLLVCFEIWTVIYELFLKKVFDLHIVLKDYFLSGLFLDNPASKLFSVYLWHYWYIPAILGLYLTLPFLANAIVKSSREVVNLFLGISILFTMLLPEVSAVLSVERKSMVTTTISIGTALSFSAVYFAFGYLIKQGALKRLKSTWLILIASIDFILLLAGSLFLDTKYIVPGRPIFGVWYTSPLLLVFSIVLFELLRRIPETDNLAVFTLFSKLSLGVYLIHRPVQMLFKKYGIVTSGNDIWKFTVLLLGSLVVSYLIAWIISLIPIVRRGLLNVR